MAEILDSPVAKVSSSANLCRFARAASEGVLSDHSIVIRMENDLISIVMPAYNSGRFLKEAVESVREQTYQNWELIIVDDCSNDGTGHEAMTWSLLDPRIKALHTAQNAGSSAARNLGVSNCQGRYLAFLDADDIWLPEKLQKQVAFMRAKNVDFSFTSYRKLGAEGQGGKIAASATVSWRDMLKSNRIGCSTVMLDLRALPGVRFPTDLGRQEDYALWLALLRPGGVAYGLDEVLVLYRVHPDSKSARKLPSVMAQWLVYRKIERMPVWLAGWYLGHYAVRGLLKSLR